ncbi:hypothetical protein [Enterococcus phage vB_EfaS_140]|uniref:Uncharacterized protein n=1 Tax=Enterococcus phage vB_EfaS_140 TaxID=2730536 RepID=A0ACA9ASB2_9CAUD|nr:hypothetical protein [Enterococcus phage vB_EfaS_140]
MDKNIEPKREVLENGDVKVNVGDNQILVTHVSDEIPVDQIVTTQTTKES